MQVEWFTDNTVFDKLRPEWDDLLHRSVTDSVFLTWDWQTVWLRNLGTGDPLIVTVRDDNRKLVGILPLFWQGGQDQPSPTLSLIGCVDVSDYLDAIVEQGREADVYSALADTLARADFPRWDRIWFCTVPGSSPTNTGLGAAAEEHGLHFERHLHDVSPLIRLPATWDEYLGMLDKKQRHEVRRKLRRVEEAGGQWVPVTGGDELERAVSDFIELHKTSQPEKHLFMDGRMQRFFFEMASALQAHGWLQLEFLELDGKRAASLFDFVYNNKVLVYNSGYNPASYGQLSPGVALFAISIRRAIEDKRSVYDFLRGNEDYKYRFGAQDTEVYEISLTRT